MERLIIKGGNPLKGEIAVHGSKNSALPLLAAAILEGGETIFHNCPNLRDVAATCKILNHLGCTVERDDNIIKINSSSLVNHDIPEHLMSEMRSSIIFLGAIISRCGKAKMCYPGGCDIGQRPIDLHLSGLRQLGAIIDEEHGVLNCRCEGRLQGAKIVFSFPSVGATENIMIAATTAKGETIINNAAAEPEIIDLANYLNKRGAIIKGAGENTINIQGVDKLYGAEHIVIPDRIVTSTYLCAAAITGGELLVTKTVPQHVAAVLPFLEQAGCKIIHGSDNIYIKAKHPLNAIKTVRTMPYPGFPTDAAAPMMAMATLANGSSIFVENIFENRYKHVAELMKMGANINVECKVSVVNGVKKLYGANVKATDLRGGASLILTGLAAEGTTYITELSHIDRGYECIEKSLSQIGADIQRTTDN